MGKITNGAHILMNPFPQQQKKKLFVIVASWKEILKKIIIKTTL